MTSLGRGGYPWLAVIYRMTVRSNPRILLVVILLPVLVAAGIGSIFLLGPLIGLIILAVVLFFAWTLGKLIRRQLATRIETLTDELLFNLHGDEKVFFPWEKVRICGFATEEGREGKDRRLFVYNEEADKMFTLTDEFEDLDGLAEELRQKSEFRELVLAPGETLKEKLRELIGRG